MCGLLESGEWHGAENLYRALAESAGEIEGGWENG